MTSRAARRIQAQADRTGKNQGFKRRAQSTAARNSKGQRGGGVLFLNAPPEPPDEIEGMPRGEFIEKVRNILQAVLDDYGVNATIDVTLIGMVHPLDPSPTTIAVDVAWPRERFDSVEGFEFLIDLEDRFHEVLNREDISFGLSVGGGPGKD